MDPLDLSTLPPIRHRRADRQLATVDELTKLLRLLATQRGIEAAAAIGVTGTSPVGERPDWGFFLSRNGPSLPLGADAEATIRELAEALGLRYRAFEESSGRSAG